MIQFKESKKIIIIVSSLGVLFIVLQFYFLDYWDQKRLEEYANAFQNGYDLGVDNSVITIFNNTEDCMVTTIFVGNNSKQIIDFSCTYDLISTP